MTLGKVLLKGLGTVPNSSRFDLLVVDTRESLILGNSTTIPPQFAAPVFDCFKHTLW